MTRQTTWNCPPASPRRLMQFRTVSAASTATSSIRTACASPDSRLVSTRDGLSPSPCLESPQSCSLVWESSAQSWQTELWQVRKLMARAQATRSKPLQLSELSFRLAKRIWKSETTLPTCRKSKRLVTRPRLPRASQWASSCSASTFATRTPS